jgi:nucleotide-binding universal stress UspA family protein
MIDQIKSCGRILLADDGSQHAHAAAVLVSNLPLPRECRVTVLRVFGSQQASDLGLLEKALAQTCSILKEKGLPVDSELLLGSPAQMITEYAQAHKIDLIVMGAKGLRATLGILLGGVAQQVVEYSSCPVLVVRTPYSGIERLLLVTDGSASSQLAVQYLGKFPLPAQMDLRVMHVLPPVPIQPIDFSQTSQPAIFESPTLSDAFAEEQERQEIEGQKMLESVVEALKGNGITAVPVLKRGDAATEIIEYIQKEKIDLTVCGSRGLSEIRSWLMGSVSRKLIHYSGGSILVVRGTSAG